MNERKKNKKNKLVTKKLSSNLVKRRLAFFVDGVDVGFGAEK